MAAQSEWRGDVDDESAGIGTGTTLKLRAFDCKRGEDGGALTGHTYPRRLHVSAA
jgi:hypothetical protein